MANKTGDRVRRLRRTSARRGTCNDLPDDSFYDDVDEPISHRYARPIEMVRQYLAGLASLKRTNHLECVGQRSRPDFAFESLLHSVECRNHA